MVQKGNPRLRGRRGPKANASTALRRQKKQERKPVTSAKPPLPSSRPDERRDPPAAASTVNGPARRNAAPPATTKKKSLGKSIVVKQQPAGRAQGEKGAGTSRASASTITSRDQRSRFSTFDDGGWDSHSGPQEYDPLQRRANKQGGNRAFNDHGLTDAEMMKACLDAIDCSKLCTIFGAVKSSCAANNEAKAPANSSKPSEWAIVKEMMALPIEDCRASSAVEEKKEVVDVARNLWSYYRGATGCIVVKWKYQAAYDELRTDPLWPYLRSCPAINDVGSRKKEGNEKRMVQVCSQGEIYASLAAKANEAQPALIQICKTIAKKLKLSKIGVGPIKEKKAAMAKAKRKYGGNLCNVTDYCRVFLVVDDIATLLALLEYVCYRWANSICRIKLSTLCEDSPHPGGYRDCKINLMVKGHICEIQLHLRKMYDISSVDGYQHYKDWILNGLEDYMRDNDVLDPSNLLYGLDRKMLGDMTEIAEETTKITSVTSITRDDEEQIVDYIAVAGLLLRHEESFKAEVICRQLINLLTATDRSPAVPSNHPEIIYLKKKLEAALRQQNLMDEADMIAEQRAKDLKSNNDVYVDGIDSVSLVSYFGGFGTSAKQTNTKLDSKEVERSKRNWMRVRQDRFGNMANYVTAREALGEVNDILENPEAGRPNFAVTTSTARVEIDNTSRSSSTGVVDESRASTDASPQVSIVKVGLRR